MEKDLMESLLFAENVSVRTAVKRDLVGKG